MSYNTIKAKADTIRNEQLVGGNTKERVANVLDDINETKADKSTMQNYVDDLYKKDKELNEKIDKVSVSGIKGEAFPDTVPTEYNPIQYPDGLFEKYEVHTAGTYTNFKKADGTPIVVTDSDLDKKLAYITVTNGVAKLQTIAIEGSTAKKVFDKNDDDNPSTMKAAADRWDKTLKVLDHFVNAAQVQEEEITMPQSGETDGKFLNGSLNEVLAADAGWGIIPISSLTGFQKLVVKGDTTSLGNNCLYLAKKNADNTFTNLKVGGDNTDFEVPIDFTAQHYLYSRFKGQTRFYKKNESPDVLLDAVKLYIDSKATGKIEGVFYPEDYGAVALDPRNPDSGKDCTGAFNAMFLDMFTNYPKINSYRVVLRGVYRIDGTPSYQGRSQIDIPFSGDVDWNFRSVYIQGLTRPSQTDRGDNVKLNPLVGSGFYCSYVNTANTYRSVIGFAPGDNFGLKIGNLFLDNIAVYIKSHAADNTSIVNNMCGIDASNISTFGFTDLYIMTTTAGLNTAEPTQYSVGLYAPKTNNMASVYGNSLKVMGFGTGAILTEHMNLNHLVSVFNKDGIQVEKSYPINIGNATLEHNLCHVRLDDGASINFGVFQTEDINDATKWFNRTGNMVKTSGSARMTIGQVMCHIWGGGIVNFSYDTGVKVRYLMDEFGNSKLT